MNRSGLRQAAMERALYRCQWPSCGEQAQELAHLHSIGAGGRKSADTLGNVMVMCRRHARYSDGEYDNRDAYIEAHNTLFKGMWPVAWETLGTLAYERAEALKRLL